LKSFHAPKRHERCTSVNGKPRLSGKSARHGGPGRERAFDAYWILVDTVTACGTAEGIELTVAGENPRGGELTRRIFVLSSDDGTVLSQRDE
jgi:hypothetical protein